MDKQEIINLRIYEEFEKRKIDFAYPTQSIYLSRADKENHQKQLASQHR